MTLTIRILNDENSKKIEFSLKGNEEADFKIDPKEESIREIQKMFDFILKNINEDWTFDYKNIREDESVEGRMALDYAETVEKEIKEIKQELNKFTVK